MEKAITTTAHEPWSQTHLGLPAAERFERCAPRLRPQLAAKLHHSVRQPLQRLQQQAQPAWGMRWGGNGVLSHQGGNWWTHKHVGRGWVCG